MTIKHYLQRALERWGYRLERSHPANRFGAMRDTLLMLRARGFDPRVVIDGGANVGQWLRIASSIFTEARFEVIEPVPACHRALDELSAGRPNITVHKLALSAPGRSVVTMAGGSAVGCTGSFVVDAGDPRAEIVCPAATLDTLFGGSIGSDDRLFLKLDVEGREMEALQGAEDLLPLVEVLLIETQFFQIDGNGLPCFGDLVAFLRDGGLFTYDIATLSGRGRDNRLVLGDVVFARSTSAIRTDDRWL
jgi:FkbM family methyltransferase